MRQLQVQINELKAVRSTEEHLQTEKDNPSKYFDLLKEKKQKSHKEQVNKMYFVPPFFLVLKSMEKNCGCLTEIFFIRKYTTKYF